MQEKKDNRTPLSIMPYDPTKRALWTDDRRNDTKTATTHVDKCLTVVTIMMMSDIDDNDDENDDKITMNVLMATFTVKNTSRNLVTFIGGHK